MKIIFFTHPAFLSSQSMPRFTRMLAEGMKRFGHTIEVWSPQPRIHRLPVPRSIKKWLGYVDQYILFPNEVRRRLKSCPPDTLFVFIDHALGPWVPLVANRPHVIHCHDFMAQKSALGEIPENPTSWTGQQYQAYIRRGYSYGKNFISVSNKTKSDLHKLLLGSASISEVVYNGLNGKFYPQDPFDARAILGAETKLELNNGYILHVGGNQWYKNRKGVIEIYNAWRKSSRLKLPLILVGHKPSDVLQELQANSPFKDDIHWLNGLTDERVRLAYAGASVMLFPSLAEGFGWPIAEAMACGCPVITTDKAPMSEVAGDAGFYIPKRPFDDQEAKVWAKKASLILNKVILQTIPEREAVVALGYQNARKFDTILAIKRIDQIYKQILSEKKSLPGYKSLATVK